MEHYARQQMEGGGGGRGNFSLRNLKTFNSFKNPVYRLYYFGMLGQMASMNMQMIAGGMLLKRLTGSPAILGAMSFANAIPMLTLALLGGVIADRVQKKYVLLLGQVAFGLVSLGIALALTFGYLGPDRAGSWWILVVSSILQGATMGLAMPSRQAIINDIVEEEELMNAISLNFMGMNSLQLFAPALAGLMVDRFGFESVYYTMTGLYIMAVVFFALMPPVVTKSVRRETAFRSIKQGFQYVYREKTIRVLLILSFIAVVLSMPYGMLMPFFADDIFKFSSGKAVGAGGLGMLMGISGTGAIAGSLVLASLPNKKRGLMLLVGGIILGVALAAFAFNEIWPLALLLIIFVGLGGTIRMSLTNTLIQYYVDDEYRGRVMSLFMMQFGLSSFGIFAAGLVAQAVGVQWAVGSFAMVLVAVSVLTLIILPQIRKLD